MLSSIKSVNIAAAYSANNYKNEKDLNELKEAFNENLKNKPEQPEKNSLKDKSMNLDKLDLSKEVQELLKREA
jgi:hypothetical protein